MLIKNIMPRVFLYQHHNEELRLSDPNSAFAPETVLNHYSHTYPLLTTAKIEGPSIQNDEVQYKFVSVLGTKG
jgi:PRTRC genetic system protein C